MTVSKNKLKELESAGLSAVKALRLEKLVSGLPFMINSNSLPNSLCYLEFPDGEIKIAAINENRDDFKIIRALTKSEISKLKRKYKLYYN